MGMVIFDSPMQRKQVPPLFLCPGADQAARSDITLVPSLLPLLTPQALISAHSPGEMPAPLVPVHNCWHRCEGSANKKQRSNAWENSVRTAWEQRPIRIRIQQIAKCSPNVTGSGKTSAKACCNQRFCKASAALHWSNSTSRAAAKGVSSPIKTRKCNGCKIHVLHFAGVFVRFSLQNLTAFYKQNRFFAFWRDLIQSFLTGYFSVKILIYQSLFLACMWTVIIPWEGAQTAHEREALFP